MGLGIKAWEEDIKVISNLKFLEGYLGEWIADQKDDVVV